jgi:hypothetical protein
MTTEMFNGEPLSDRELFKLLRESFPDDESCWETVRESQEAYNYLTRQVVLLQMGIEQNDINQHRDDERNAA